MFNPVKNLAGWLSGTSSTPASEEASGQGQLRTQGTGPVELTARPHAPGTTAIPSGSSSVPHTPRASLQLLRGQSSLSGDAASSRLHERQEWDFIPLHSGDTAAGPLRSPGSQGSESPGSEGSTEVFLSLPSSMRWNTNVNVVSASGRLDAAALPVPGDPLPPPAPRVVALRERLAAALGDIPFSATVGQEDPAQLALQERYLDRAAQIAERREIAFGTTQPYRLGAAMTTQTQEGSLAAVYEGFQSFVTSSFRSPSGGATGLSLADKENVFPIDQALITATVQGALAYAAEGAMTAMSNRAALSNMPKIARNKFEDLFYEHGVRPDTVLLVVTRTGDRREKEFMRADDPRAPTPEALAERATRKLSAIKLRQDLWDGKSFAFPLVPLMSGGFNTLRRFVSSANTLKSPLPLFVTSALASGSASGVVKLGLELGKTRAQVQIDDLMGGQQTVNLFRLSRPRADVEPVRWSDAGRLLGFLGESARESLALAGEATRTFAHSAADMGYRYMLVNGIANVTGVGFGGLIGQLFRKGRHFGALPGESPQSRANIAGQMAQSTFGDALWRGLKEVMKGRELDANASLKLRRATQLSEQVTVARTERLALQAQAAGIPEGSAVWAAQRLVAPVAEGQQSAPVDVEARGSLRSRLTGGARLELASLRETRAELDALQGTRAELAALDLREAAPQERAQRDGLTRQVDKLIALLRSHAADQQWLEPRN